jgi:WD40 repeat protein
MFKLPKILASHIVRGSSKGEDHGGIYCIDLETEKYERVLDWNDNINWDGRGSDRGLRGIAIHKSGIYVATSNSILLLNDKFEIVKRFENHYLNFCHEIFIYKNVLYIVSTGFDSIILFDIKSEQFLYGICFRNKKRARTFNLSDKRIVKKIDGIHLNNVFCNNSGMFISGTSFDRLLHVSKNLNVSIYSRTRKETHNCRPFGKDSVIMNDTKGGKIIIQSREGNVQQSFIVNKIHEKRMVGYQNERIARQPFGRGLAEYKSILVGGSSPGMISVYDTKTGKKIKDIIMSNDIRISIHGLEIDDK